MMNKVQANVEEVHVNITERESSVTVHPQIISQAVVIAPGPQGPPGTAGAGYLHVQSSSSTTWTINHNLGFRPSVELFDTGNQEIDGAISHPSVNQTIVTMKPATAGSARLT